MGDREPGTGITEQPLLSAAGWRINVMLAMDDSLLCEYGPIDD